VIEVGVKPYLYGIYSSKLRILT
jgi:hypothetical protein